MDKKSIFAVILAGGSGTRLWPMSRQMLPKQFINLLGKGTLLDATVERVSPFVPKNNVIVVTNTKHAFGAGYKCLKNLKTIIEPVGRNTAPSIGLACLYALKLNNDPVLMIMPSDHVIKKQTEFIKTLKTAVAEALNDRIVTIGIKPVRPESGYGYIETVRASSKTHPVPVKRFVEKPDAATAKQYLKTGRHFWNAGIFIFKASVMLGEIKKHLPKLHKLLQQLDKTGFNGNKINYGVLNKLFPLMPGISIDYGVMEKSDFVSMVPADIGWNDLGSWDYVHRISDKDRNNNSAKGDVIAIDCKNNLLYSNSRLITAIGISDTAIIETADAILVSPLKRSQEVKNIVDILKRDGKSQYNEHLRVECPWGLYTVLSETGECKVELLNVNPGQHISCRFHGKRSGHWVVTGGKAEVSVNGKKMILMPGQSVDIPAGANHKLSNPHKKDLEIIEVQTGIQMI